MKVYFLFQEFLDIYYKINKYTNEFFSLSLLLLCRKHPFQVLLPNTNISLKWSIKTDGK